MKKLLLAGMFFALLVLSGCKSTPEEPIETPETTTETEVQPTETATDSLVDANAALKADIEKARAMAITAGAEQYFSEELMVVDVASTEVHAVYEDGGDEEAFNENATDILYQYRALEEAAKASKAAETIAKMNLESYDANAYAEGNAASEAAFALFNSGSDGKSIYDEAKKASDAYGKVLFTAFTSLAKEERDRFMTVKAQADEIKAGVADKSNYANAVVFFTQGDQDLVSDNPEAAYGNFTIAADAMTTVYESVVEKRRLAQEAIDRAKRRLEDAEEVATTADTIVPLADVESLESVNEDTAENTPEAE